MAGTVTESVVDAKDAAVEARMESKVEKAVADLKTHISERLTAQTRWIVGWVTVVGGIVIAVALRGF